MCLFYKPPADSEAAWSFNHVLSSEMSEHFIAFFSSCSLSPSQNVLFGVELASFYRKQ